MANEYPRSVAPPLPTGLVLSENHSTVELWTERQGRRIALVDSVPKPYRPVILGQIVELMRQRVACGENVGIKRLGDDDLTGAVGRWFQQSDDEEALDE